MRQPQAICIFNGDPFGEGHHAASALINRLDAHGRTVRVWHGDRFRSAAPTLAIDALAEARLADENPSAKAANMDECRDEPDCGWLCGSPGSDAVFVTDMPTLMALAYRLYQGVFSAFFLALPPNSAKASASENAHANANAGYGSGSGTGSDDDKQCAWDGAHGSERDYSPAPGIYADLAALPPHPAERLEKPICICMANPANSCMGSGKASWLALAVTALPAALTGVCSRFVAAEDVFDAGDQGNAGSETAGSGNVGSETAGSNPAAPRSNPAAAGANDACQNDACPYDPSRFLVIYEHDSHWHVFAPSAGQPVLVCADGAVRSATLIDPIPPDIILRFPHSKPPELASLEQLMLACKPLAPITINMIINLSMATEMLAKALAHDSPLNRAAAIARLSAVGLANGMRATTATGKPEPNEARNAREESANKLRKGLARILSLSCIFWIAIGADRRKCVASMCEDAVRAGLGYPHIIFMVYQCIAVTFRSSAGRSRRTDLAIRHSYGAAVKDCMSSLRSRLTAIPPQDRDPGLCVVLVTQFLGNQHSSTKTALEMALYLSRSQGRRAVIVNTGEFCAPYGSIPFALPFTPTMAQLHDDGEMLEYRGKLIEYRQVGGEMPMPDAMQAAISKTLGMRPYFIVAIGTPSLVAELCALAVPTISFVTSSGLPLAYSPAVYASGTLSADELLDARRMHSEPSLIIPGQTFQFASQQSRALNRSHFGIPEDAFAVAIVGNRLTHEVDAAFVAMLDEAVSAASSRNPCRPIYAVFIGSYFEADKDKLTAMAVSAPGVWRDASSLLVSRTVFTGYIEDLSGAFGMCDMFANPARQGGGISSVLAMSRGLPVATLPSGDVASLSGPSFHVGSFKEMAHEIARCASDQEYFSSRSAEARERAREVTDADGVLDAAFEAFMRTPAWEDRSFHAMT